LNPVLSVDSLLHRLAVRWAGAAHADALVALWDQVEEAVSYMPAVPLYSHFGFVWLRTWVRPLIPNLEAIPEEGRRYYERFMVSTANNPGILEVASCPPFTRSSSVQLGASGVPLSPPGKAGNLGHF
jgi:hypothetical protein